jgi:periplasmic divalent cation tolerance protein
MIRLNPTSKTADMEKDRNYLLLLTTCPNMEVARALAQHLLENHLVACVNMLPHIHSMYLWQDKIMNDAEALLFMKTRREHYAMIAQTLSEKHPYDVPELIALPIESGLPRYLAWIDSVVMAQH